MSEKVRFGNRHHSDLEQGETACLKNGAESSLLRHAF